MIRIELDVAVAIYVGLSLILLLLWMIVERRSSAGGQIGRSDMLWSCPTCLFVYIDSRSDLISECPRCKSLHKHEETG